MENPDGNLRGYDAEDVASNVSSEWYLRFNLFTAGLDYRVRAPDSRVPARQPSPYKPTPSAAMIAAHLASV